MIPIQVGGAAIGIVRDSSNSALRRVVPPRASSNLCPDAEQLAAVENVSAALREVESTLDEIVVHEKERFEKVGNAYRWKKH